MDHPIVSVIIPSYNSGKYVEETLASVLSQSYTNFEVIVVDDGSVDGQKDCIFKWANRDRRVRYIYQDNQGVSSARNVGFNHSSGNYIAFLDADDVWMPNNLAVKIEKFEKGNFGLVHSDGCLIDERSNIVDGLMAGHEGRLLKNMLAWTGTQVPGPSSILVKREVINTIGLFDTNLSTSADQDFFLRVSSRYNIGRAEMVTWKYRLHSGNMHKRISLMEKDVLFVYKKVSAKGLFDNYWFERKYQGVWRFCPSTTWGERRPLMFTEKQG